MKRSETHQWRRAGWEPGAAVLLSTLQTDAGSPAPGSGWSLQQSPGREDCHPTGTTLMVNTELW